MEDEEEGREGEVEDATEEGLCPSFLDETRSTRQIWRVPCVECHACKGNQEGGREGDRKRGREVGR
jgi:hypothetical protein